MPKHKTRPDSWRSWRQRRDRRTRQAPFPRRELVKLLAYLETGSHKAGAHRLGISESTSRQRVSQLIQRLCVTNTLQACSSTELPASAALLVDLAKAATLNLVGDHTGVAVIADRRLKAARPQPEVDVTGPTR